MKFFRHIWALGLLPFLVWPGPAATASTANGTCLHIVLRVALAAGQAADQVVSATYCQPAAWAGGPREVDVLTPGATYNSAYWDWPANPSLYSYMAKTLRAGRAAFDYDRVGTGLSSHPPSTRISIGGEAYILHQMISWLRDRQGYSQVNSIGHSLGSVIAIEEAGRYQDITRLVVTGLLHLPNVGAGFAATLLSLMHPAALDPQFPLKGLDAGYLTTIPGERGADFYSPSADPSVIAYDESHKDVVPLTDLSGLATTWAQPPGPNSADAVTAPVLVVIGQQDAIFCAAPPIFDCSQQSELVATELPFYPLAASLTVDSVPGTGHDIALHPSADQSFAQINQWIETH